MPKTKPPTAKEVLLRLGPRIEHMGKRVLVLEQAFEGIEGTAARELNKIRDTVPAFFTAHFSERIMQQAGEIAELRDRCSRALAVLRAGTKDSAILARMAEEAIDALQ